MGLPKINAPEYELTLPSQDKPIKYRPFLVKEEKLLLIAQETGGDKEMFKAIKTICDECTFGTLEFDGMPMFDLEYLFLNIRAKSVGEVVELELKYPGDEDIKIPTSIDLTKIEVKTTEGHTNQIDITDDIKVMMLYPQFELMALIMGEGEGGGNAIENAFRLVGSCMGQIYFGEEMYDAQDQSENEIQEFLESLTQQQFAKLQNFFETMPKLKHDIVLVHPKTKKKATITLEGLNSFF